MIGSESGTERATSDVSSLTSSARLAFFNTQGGLCDEQGMATAPDASDQRDGIGMSPQRGAVAASALVVVRVGTGRRLRRSLTCRPGQTGATLTNTIHRTRR